MSIPTPSGGRTGASPGPRRADWLIRVYVLKYGLGHFHGKPYEVMMGATRPHIPLGMRAADQKGRLFWRPQFLFCENNLGTMLF